MNLDIIDNLLFYLNQNYDYTTLGLGIAVVVFISTAIVKGNYIFLKLQIQGLVKLVFITKPLLRNQAQNSTSTRKLQKCPHCKQQIKANRLEIHIKKCPAYKKLV